MTSLRFLLTWAAVEPQKGVYDDAYLAKVAERMQWAKDAGLLVVLDMHQDLFGEGFASGGGDGAPRWACDEANYAGFTPSSPWYLNYLTHDVTACYDGFWASDELRGHYAAAWAHVAEKLAGSTAVVGFDVMNEPYLGSHSLGSFEADTLEPFYASVVLAVRAVAPDWVAFLEPASSRNLGIATGLTPFSFRDVVYSPHSYDRDAESGKGFAPTHRAAVLQNLAALSAEASSLGAGLWVGEYGGVATAPGITPYMDAEYDGFAAVGGGSAYWAYDRSDGYGLLDVDGSEKKELLDVLVRPAPERVAGDAPTWTFDEQKRVFSLRYHALPSVSAPTTIAVPARVYGASYTVDCGGCTFEKQPGRLVLTSAPPGDPASVVVGP
jgi:endoglycosylceramidase